MPLVFTLLSLVIAQATGADAPKVKVSTLSGRVVAGTLAGIDASGITFADNPEKLSLDQTLTIDFPQAKALQGTAPFIVFGAEGSRLRCQSYGAKDRMADLTLTGGQKLRLPLDQIAGVQWKETDSAEAVRKFEQSLDRRPGDRLIVLRDGQRFELDGIVGPANEDGITFVVDGEEVPVKRERIYAIVYAQRGEPAEAQATILDRAGNLWVTDEVVLRGGSIQLRLPGGLRQLRGAENIVRIDFSRGRIVFLSDLEPTLMQHTPFFDVSMNYRRDTNLIGEPIRVNGTDFAKGLVLHSKTVLEYDLGGRYRQFECVLGIEDSAGALGDAIVRVQADGKQVFEGQLQAGQPGRPLSLQVENVQKLVVDVDFGKLFDLGDHVVFGNARLVK